MKIRFLDSDWRLDSIGVGSQSLGVSIGIGGELNKRIDAVLVLMLVWFDVGLSLLQ